MNKANFHAICLKVYEAIEELATQFYESQSGYVLTVQHNFVDYRVTVDIFIENYNYDEENYVLYYNTIIVCTDFLAVNNSLFTSDAEQEMNNELIAEFQLETLYDDNN